jgi:hypothetical protein
MRAEDLEQYRIHFPHWAKLTEGVQDICLLSGDNAQRDVLCDAFPDARVNNVHVDTWDLNQPGRWDYDLIAGMNVFMYSPDPDLWFKNVFAQCRYLWLQDPVCGRRGAVELGDGPTGDGDAMRYGFDPLLRTRLPNGYDLSKHQERLIRLCAYRLDVPTDLPYGLSHMAFLRGDL